MSQATLTLRDRVFKIHADGSVEVGPDKASKREVDAVMVEMGIMEAEDAPETVAGHPIQFENDGVTIGDRACKLHLTCEDLERIQAARDAITE